MAVGLARLRGDKLAPLCHTGGSGPITDRCRETDELFGNARVAEEADITELTATSEDPRRRSNRLILRLHTGVGQAGRAFDAEVLNLSPSGMLVKTSASLSLDDPLEVVLPKVGPVVAKVVWFDDQLYGCSFASQLTDEEVEAANLASGQTDQTHGVDNETLGARIKRLRKNRGLSMRALAGLAGVSKPTLWKWESDRVRPRHTTMQRLAVELGISELELVYGAPAVHENEALESGSLADIVRDARRRIADAAGVDESRVDVRIDWGEED